MPLFVFECDTCGTIDDDVEMSVDQYVAFFPCGALPDCCGTMRRMWSRVLPSIARVHGAGGSPGR